MTFPQTVSECISFSNFYAFLKFLRTYETSGTLKENIHIFMFTFLCKCKHNKHKKITSHHKNYFYLDLIV